MLKSLEKAGFVEKKVDSVDQRFVRLQLTEKGVDAAKSVDKIFSEICEESLEGLDDEKKQVLIDLLSKITENMMRHLNNLGGASKDDKLLSEYLKPYWKYVLLVVLLLTFQAVMNLYLPNLNADIINNGVVKGMWTTYGKQVG